MTRIAPLLFALLLAPVAESPVADAAERGDVDTVRELLRDGADVNAAQSDGTSALHWGAIRDDVAVIEVLLYAGANTEATTRLGGYTPLHLAAREGNAAGIDALIEGGADHGAMTTTGVTALHYAAQSGKADAVEALVRRGAKVDTRTRADEQTPLMWATAANRLAAMRVLLEADADPTLTTTVIDYAEVAEKDGPERRLRSQLASVRRDAERRAAQAQEEATAAETPEVAEEEPPSKEEQPSEEDEPTEKEEASEEQPSEEDEPSEEEEPADEQPSEEDEPGEDEEEPSEEAAAEAEGPPEEEATEEETAGEEEPGEEGSEEDPDEETSESEESESEEEEEEERPLGYNDLVGREGGFAAIHFASRDGHVAAAKLLLEHGAPLDQPTAGDGTTPMLMATINGNFDLAMHFLDEGADPNAVAEDGAAALFTVLNRRWGPKAAYPQPQAFTQQQTDYLELLRALIDAGADVNHRTGRHIWYTSFNFDMLGVNFAGATAFWRAAYATDLDAMRLLVAAGADPSIPTRKVPSRRFRRGGDDEDKSGLDPVPTGGPAVYPIHAASGVGYGEGFAANSHSHAPDSWLPAVTYLVEEHGADVNARDLNGYSPLHHAAARGDNELIEYLVAQGADVMVVSRRGETTVDMANGPRQRVQPFPGTIALLESLGAVNNHNCQSCE
ncbi:MAG: ankyrin repeat domain-containing protein [Gemmatimonadetes bacterium]|nr:ankyrin repeat domain-containing protein [Gemmatimonadota bacterium]